MYPQKCKQKKTICFLPDRLISEHVRFTRVAPTNRKKYAVPIPDPKDPQKAYKEEDLIGPNNSF